MQVGEPFSPYRIFAGIHLPWAIASYAKLGWSAKAVWCYLARCAGERDHCWPSQSTMGRRLGLSLRCVKNAVVTLAAEGFIRPDGKRRRNRIWKILWHPCFEGQNVPVSERGMGQNVPSFGDFNDPEDSMGAECAPSIGQNVPLEGAKCAPLCSPPTPPHVQRNLQGKVTGKQPRAPAHETSDGEGNGPVDPRETRVPLLIVYRDLTVRDPSMKDRRTSEELMSRADWDVDIALAAMKLCHRRAVDDAEQPRSLAYYAPAIIEALELGRMPTPPAGGRDGKVKRRAGVVDYGL